MPVERSSNFELLCIVAMVMIDQVRKYLAPYIVRPMAERCEKLAGSVIKIWLA